MDTFNLKINSQDIPRNLIVLDSTYKYSTRKPAPIEHSINFIKEYFTKDSENLSPILQGRLKLLSQEFSSYSYPYEEERYGYVVPGILSDKFNCSEIFKCMQYDKEFCWTYSWHDKLDYCIAGIFDTPLAVVRERLLHNCKNQGISYEELSYAFCSADTDAICNIDLNVFVGISDLLDQTIMDISNNPKSAIFHLDNVLLDLTDSILSAEDRITIFLVTRISHFIQLYLNAIILQFKNSIAPFITSKTVMLVSKGLDNIVITTKYEQLPPVAVQIDAYDTITVYPKQMYKLGGNHEDCWYTRSI